MTTAPSLPRRSSGVTEIVDPYGNRYRYDARTASWVNYGVAPTNQIATETVDGLLSTTAYTRLRQLRQLIDSGHVDFTRFKVHPGLDAYWYYLKSTDKSIRIEPEGPETVRFEVDRGRVYRLLGRSACVGDPGPRGDQGERGIPGLPAPPELCFVPEITNLELSFAVHVPTPLDTKISVRLHPVSTVAGQARSQLSALRAFYAGRDQSQLLALRRLAVERQALGEAGPPCAVSGLSPSLAPGSTVADFPSVTIEIGIDGVATVVESLVSIDSARTAASFRLEREAGLLCGTVYATSNWAGDWCVKARQKGPTGEKGDSGSCYFDVTNCNLGTNDLLVSTCPLVNLRADCDRHVIYWYCSDVGFDVCLDRVTVPAGAAALNDRPAIESSFLAAQVTLDSCKGMRQWTFTPSPVKLPKLTLVPWTPLPGCATARHFDAQSLTWTDGLSEDVCGPVRLAAPDGQRALRYPWLRVVAAEPERDLCCADDQFYCPNVQDGPCDKPVVDPEDPPPVPPDPDPEDPPPPEPGPSPVGLAASAAASIHDSAAIPAQAGPTVRLGAHHWKVRTRSQP